MELRAFPLSRPFIIPLRMVTDANVLHCQQRTVRLMLASGDGLLGTTIAAPRHRHHRYREVNQTRLQLLIPPRVYRHHQLSSVEYHFTLLEKNGLETNFKQCIINESVVSRYLESGDILLAHSWKINKTVKPKTNT